MKSEPYAIDKTGEHLFVQLSCAGISPLVAAIDCLTLTFFGNSDVPYLRVDDAISWHVKEVRESNGKSGSFDVAATMRDVRARFNRGELETVS